MAYKLQQLLWLLVPVAFAVGAAGALGIAVPDLSLIWVLGGVAVGYLNIRRAESTAFMVALLVLAGGAAALAVIPYVGTVLQAGFAGVTLVAAPAAIIVAGKAVWKLAK